MMSATQPSPRVPSRTPRRPLLAGDLPGQGRAAVRGGIFGNYVDQLHIFLPAVALAPALPTLAGPHASAPSAIAFVVMATLIGRPLGAMVFGRIADAVGRTRTTRVAILGTAACTLGIAVMPDYTVLGAGTIALVLALRFLGGAFLAGEYTSAIPLAMEWSKPRERGLASGLIMSMSPWAQATIAVSTALLLVGLGPDSYASWGWRISFATGAVASVAMFFFYSRRVADAPVFHRSRPAPGAPVGLRQVMFGRWAGAFWQVFALMSGLWFLTNMVVLVLSQRLKLDVELSPTGVSTAMAIASVGQAVAMAVAGQLSTVTGRRTFFIGWGLAAAVLGPALWWVITGAHHSALAVGLLAAALQVVTVAAYGPVGAYLNERFPTQVRSTAYGTAYSLSIVIPALYPYYLPTLESWLGHQVAPMTLIALGGALVALAGACGPRLAGADLDAQLDGHARVVSESFEQTVRPLR